MVDKRKHPGVSFLLAAAVKPEAKREPKSERIYVRLTSSQREDMARAATLAGLSLTDFITQSARKAMIETLDQHYVIELSREEARTLQSLVENPPAPRPSVIERFRRAPKVKRA